VKEAEKFASEDTKKKEEVETINQADSLVYATEKSLKEFGDKVSSADRADIESRLNELKQAIKDKNITSVKRGTEELTKAAHKLAEEVYKKTAGSAKGGAGAGPGQEGPRQEEGSEPEKQSAGGGKEENIIDAEYTAEDEGEKGKKK